MPFTFTTWDDWQYCLAQANAGLAPCPRCERWGELVQAHDDVVVCVECNDEIDLLKKMETHTKCGGCFDWFPHDEITTGIPRIEGFGRVIDLCFVCSIAYAKQQRKHEKHVEQRQRVYYHRNRAKREGLPATLTTEQWCETLEHFDYTCAYCGGDFQVFEHFIPLSLGGGTTPHNCVPACHKCDKSKKGRHPLRDVYLIKTENIERVRVYLESQRQQYHPHDATNAQDVRRAFFPMT